MLALRYLLQCARQAQKPLVICFGLGTNQGDHSGYMPLAEALDTISRMNTVYVVSAAGNEAGRGHHFYGKMENTSDYQNVEVLVPENEGGFTMELWASPPDLFAVGMISPLGETIPPIPPRAGSVTSISFLLEQTVIEVSYEPVEIASRRSACLSESTESNTRHLGISDLSKADFFWYFPYLASDFGICHGKYPLFEFQSGYNDRLPVKCRRSYHLCCL